MINQNRNDRYSPESVNLWSITMRDWIGYTLRTMPNRFTKVHTAAERSLSKSGIVDD